MLKIKELMEMYVEDEFFIVREFVPEDKRYTPIKYRGILERIGCLTVWNEVGGIENEFYIYRPLGGGELVYDPK